MKRLYLIGGPMGVGKTTICNEIVKKLPNSFILGGDECWNANKDYANPNAQKEVLKEIVRRLNKLISNSNYQNIFFTWVMHKQEIISAITDNLNKDNLKIINISLIANKDNLIKRLNKDITNNLRESSVIDRSLERLTHFNNLNSIKIDTTNKSIKEVADLIMKI